MPAREGAPWGLSGPGEGPHWPYGHRVGQASPGRGATAGAGRTVRAAPPDAQYGVQVTATFTVFPASPSEGDAVGEIHAASWRAAYAAFFSPDFFVEALRSRRTRWHDVLTQQTRNTALLGARDGRPLAFSYFGPSPSEPGSMELFGFYGHPDGWGSGVAKALMTASLTAMREGGARRVHLWTLRDTPQSRRFYAKHGFTESGVVRGFDYGDGNPLQQVEYELVLR